ncbi:hypothetical protein ACQKO5_04335 [Novosphingobium subterraneum]|uniref:hypothetical protein n=1 Tax=Novosphingobium subterraneum TaxID=48936 RepID=UPI003D0556E7
MTIKSAKEDFELVSDQPLNTIMVDGALDIDLLSDKATIAAMFFEAFGATTSSATDDPGALNQAARHFVETCKIGKWDLFALLDSALPNVDIMALFAFLSEKIGADPAHHVLFENEAGVLFCHRSPAT